MHSDQRFTPRATPVPPLVGRWRTALVEAGVIDTVDQLGIETLRRAPAPSVPGVSVAARGTTAKAAARVLAEHLSLRRVDPGTVPDSDIVVLLGDALGPRMGTVVCDFVIPLALDDALDHCREAIRCAAATSIPVVLLRRAALPDGAGTLLSVMIAPEAIDPAYDVACATSQIVEVLGRPVVPRSSPS